MTFSERMKIVVRNVLDILDDTKSNKRLDFTKDLNAQHYTLCGLTSAKVKYVEKPIIDMDTARSRRSAQVG